MEALKDEARRCYDEAATIEEQKDMYKLVGGRLVHQYQVLSLSSKAYLVPLSANLCLQLLSLIEQGGAHHVVRAPLMPDNNVNKTTIKELGRRQTARWALCRFKHPAREDNLALEHWVREDKLQEPYVFAKFSRGVEIPTFTTDAYLLHLVSPDWTERETRLLFEMCRRFDRRFILVHDRYTYELRNMDSSLPERSMEDLKLRYYTCVKKLAVARGDRQDDLQRTFKFDHGHETLRKQQLVRLSERTADDVQKAKRVLEQWRVLQQKKKSLGVKKTAVYPPARMPESAQLKKQPKKKQQQPQHNSQQQVARTPSTPVSAAADTQPRKPVPPAAQRQQVKLRSMHMHKSLGKVHPKVQIFIDVKLSDLNFTNPLPTTKIASKYLEIRIGLLALGNVTKAAQALKLELKNLAEQRKAYMAKFNIPPQLLQAAAEQQQRMRQRQQALAQAQAQARAAGAQSSDQQRQAQQVQAPQQSQAQAQAAGEAAPSGLQQQSLQPDAQDGQTIAKRAKTD